MYLSPSLTHDGPGSKHEEIGNDDPDIAGSQVCEDLGDIELV